MLSTTDLLELAAIEGAITRTTAMKESCIRWNAPASAVEYADSEIRRYLNEKATLLNKNVQPDYYYSHLERKAELLGRLFEAFDPDQSDNVSWWAI